MVTEDLLSHTGPESRVCLEERAILKARDSSGVWDDEPRETQGGPEHPWNLTRGEQYRSDTGETGETGEPGKRIWSVGL